MQAISPEFFATNTTNPAIPQERPGDGLFDALLREEEARYEKNPLPETEPPRDDRHDDRREPDRPEDYSADDRGRGDDRPEGRPDDRSESPDARPDREPDDKPAYEQDDALHESDEAVADGTPNAGETDTYAAESTPTKQPTAAEPQAIATAAPARPTQTTATTASAQPGETGAAHATATTASSDRSGGTAGHPQSNPVQANPQSAATPPAVATTAETAAKTNAAVSPAQSPTKQTAEAAAAAGASATAGQAAKPVQSAAKPEAPGQAVLPAEHKPQAAQGPAKDGRVTNAAQIDATAKGLTSRPSVALGGAAATAAIAEEAAPKPQATTTTSRSKAKPGQTAASGPGAQTDSIVSKTAAAQNGGVANPGAATDTGRSAAQTGTVRSLGAEVPTTSGGGQPSQSLGATGSSLSGGSLQSASFTEALNTARSSGAPAPAEQIALQVQKAQLAGKDQVTIKLHPAELGRIDVKLENGDDGVLRAVISAERSETLDLLQRDARGLERALQDAGVKTDSGSLNFNLKGQQDPEQGQAEARMGKPAGGADAETEGPADPPPPPAFASHDGALDITV